MSLWTDQRTITDTPTLIAPAAVRNVIVLGYISGDGDVFLGGPSVTVSNGLPLMGVPGTPFSWTQSEALYGVCATGKTAVVGMMEGY